MTASRSSFLYAYTVRSAQCGTCTPPVAESLRLGGVRPTRAIGVILITGGSTESTIYRHATMNAFSVWATPCASTASSTYLRTLSLLSLYPIDHLHDVTWS